MNFQTNNRHMAQDQTSISDLRMQLVGNCEQLLNWALKKGDETLRAFRIKHNARSVDGLRTPGRH